MILELLKKNNAVLEQLIEEKLEFSINGHTWGKLSGKKYNLISLGGKVSSSKGVKYVRLIDEKAKAKPKKKEAEAKPKKKEERLSSFADKPSSYPRSDDK